MHKKFYVINNMHKYVITQPFSYLQLPVNVDHRDLLHRHATNIRLLVIATTSWQSYKLLTTCNYSTLLTKVVVIRKLVVKKNTAEKNHIAKKFSQKVPDVASCGYPSSVISKEESKATKLNNATFVTNLRLGSIPYENRTIILPSIISFIYEINTL